MNNRQTILEAALTLFNESGYAAVSTNHIAAAAGVSPGNLYYHFRNRGEIVLALVREMYGRWDAELTLPTDRLPTVADLDTLLKTTFGLIAAYRFFYRDLVSLVRGDGALQNEYLTQRHRGMGDFRQMVAALASAGVLPQADGSIDLGLTADLCWMVTEFWLQNLEIEGLEPDEAQRERGAAMIRRLLGLAPPVSGSLAS
jgi:AcrR family transcriptional regulator